MISNNTFHPSIPVLNLSDFLGHDAASKSAFVSGLRRAMSEVGFVALTGVSVNKELLNKSYEVSKQFFSKSQEEKERLKSSTNSGERGYVNLESPKELPITKRDQKEFLHIGRELSVEQNAALGYPENIWPTDWEMKAPVMEMYGHLEELVSPIGKAISLAIGEEENYLEKLTEQGDHLMRFLHYSPATEQTANWAAEHTDLNLFTIIPPATSKGLQVLTKDGVWIDAIVPEEAVVVNVSDMLENHTNGLLRSAVHRVVPQGEGIERYSIVYFPHTRDDCDLSPIKRLVHEMDGVQRFPNATRRELLDWHIVALGRAKEDVKQRVVESGITKRFSRLDNDRLRKINAKVKSVIALDS